MIIVCHVEHCKSSVHVFFSKALAQRYTNQIFEDTHGNNNPDFSYHKETTVEGAHVAQQILDSDGKVISEYLNVKHTTVFKEQKYITYTNIDKMIKI